MSDAMQTQAAVQLAEHYIELILSSNPELLIGDVAGAELEEIRSYAHAFTEFRQSLIDNLTEQSLPAFEIDDSDDDPEDGDD